MLLAADVGNTNVVFALFDGRTIKARWRIATDPRRTGDEYAVWLLQLAKLQGFDKSDIEQVIIGSVVPRAIHNLTVLSEKYLGITPLGTAKAMPTGASSWISSSRVRSAPTALAPRRAREIRRRFDRDRFRPQPPMQSISPALTRAGSSPPASTCRWTHWSATQPNCRALRSKSRRATASSVAIPRTRCSSACSGAMSRSSKD